jgi:hypothetical protein
MTKKMLDNDVDSCYDGSTFKNGEKMYDLISNIISYEEGELSNEEAIELFQHLVDNKMAWILQGSYGRTAAHLIEEGLVIANR